MGLVIYNTLSRQKEPFETIEPGKVRMYVCGPTVYDKAHVGHAMSSVVFDVLRRYLQYRGYEVRHVMNYTDVEDKVIRRAQEMGVDPLQLAEKYIEEYDDHLHALNILPASVFPRASEEIATIVKMVQGLVDGGYAYVANGDVYFRVEKDAQYGKLSGRRLEDLRAGSRIEVDEHKEHAEDFALWKAAKPGEPSWDSPWGKGRPGWHIECSAMSLRYLGEQIDIHGGGNDLIFPHHENEIAQTESLTQKPFARYWVHNGMLQLSGEKMSKSEGNMVTVEEFLAHHEGDAFRLMVLNSNYRSPLSYNDEIVGQAEAALERLRGALRSASPGENLPPDAERQLQAKAQQTKADFERWMDDDFNTPNALAALFDLVRAINQGRDAGVGEQPLSTAQDVLRQLAGVLGLRLSPKAASALDAAPFIDLLVEIRGKLRQERNWALTDEIRERLQDLGVLLEDEREGTTWRLR
jgi:cysteinyl-tRNA synthetase